MKKLSSLVTVLILLLAGCVSPLPEHDFSVQSFSPQGQKLKMWTDGSKILVAYPSWQILDITLGPTNPVVLARCGNVLPMPKLTRIRANPKHTATLISHSTGRSYTVAITDNAQGTVRLGKVECQILDIRPEERVVLAKEVATGRMFSLRQKE